MSYDPVQNLYNILLYEKIYSSNSNLSVKDKILVRSRYNFGYLYIDKNIKHLLLILDVLIKQKRLDLIQDLHIFNNVGNNGEIRQAHNYDKKFIQWFKELSGFILSEKMEEILKNKKEEREQRGKDASTMPVRFTCSIEGYSPTGYYLVEPENYVIDIPS